MVRIISKAEMWRKLGAGSTKTSRLSSSLLERRRVNRARTVSASFVATLEAPPAACPACFFCSGGSLSATFFIWVLDIYHEG